MIYVGSYGYLKKRCTGIYCRLCRELWQKGGAGHRVRVVRKGVSDRLVYLFLRECFLKLVSSEGDGDIDEGTYAEMILTFAHGISTLKGGAYINRKLKERRYNETY